MAEGIGICISMDDDEGGGDDDDDEEMASCVRITRNDDAKTGSPGIAP